ncbi:MAG: hypothetical protein ACXAD7_26320, partial [Candidatus Kariarchaeaceae archaeon]
MQRYFISILILLILLPITNIQGIGQLEDTQYYLTQESHEKPLENEYEAFMLSSDLSIGFWDKDLDTHYNFIQGSILITTMTSGVSMCAALKSTWNDTGNAIIEETETFDFEQVGTHNVSLLLGGVTFYREGKNELVDFELYLGVFEGSVCSLYPAKKAQAFVNYQDFERPEVFFDENTVEIKLINDTNNEIDHVEVYFNLNLTKASRTANTIDFYVSYQYGGWMQFAYDTQFKDLEAGIHTIDFWFDGDEFWEINFTGDIRIDIEISGYMDDRRYDAGFVSMLKFLNSTQFAEPAIL